jgi:hypothetical protein
MKGRLQVKASGAAKVVALLLLSPFVMRAETLCSSSLQEKSVRMTQAKQEAVEAAADRVMKRFYKTLDFGVLWKEMFVSDPELRHKEVIAVTFNKLDYRTKEPISFEARERAYIALGNLNFCLSALGFTNRALLDNPEFTEEMNKSAKPFTGSRPSRNTAELYEMARKIDDISAQLRKYILRDKYNTPDYRLALSKFKEDERDKLNRLPSVFEPAGLKKSTPIYMARREMFYLYFIEERGALKLLTFTSRRRF